MRGPVQGPSDGGDAAVAGPLTVGCALSGKKISRYMTEEFIESARKEGLSICLVDTSRPLEEQGPFDVLLHKIFSQPWEQEVAEYCRRHPECLVLDSPEAIRSLSDRETMLQGIEDQDVVVWAPGAQSDQQPKPAVRREPKCIRVKVPPQIIVRPHEVPEGLAQAVRDRGLQYPLLLKPLGAHGVGIGCHTIAVVSSEEGLRELATLGRASPTPLDLTQPVVAQEYIYHRGVMFKVYVVGSHAVFACRPSLGEQDLLPDPEGRTTHVRFFQGVSRKPVADLLSDEDDDGEGARGGEAAGGGLVSQLSRDGCSTPELLEAAGSGLPDWFVSGLGREIQGRLGLNLFNIDVIMEEGEDRQDPATAEERTAFVVDINYFPGYDKLPGWQSMLLNFLKESAKAGRKRRIEFAQNGIAVPADRAGPAA